jgi:hypothetical protein
MVADLSISDEVRQVSFGREFAPEPMDEAFVRRQIAALAARTGICHPERCEWMIPMILADDQSGLPPDRQVLADPRLDEALTDLGNTNPAWAVAAITLAPRFAANHQEQRRAAVEFGRPNRLSAVLDQRTCEAAKALHRAVFEIGTEPELPLPDCDVWHCRCMLVGHYTPRGR